jgi:AcrR family transcriptional regulator
MGDGPPQGRELWLRAGQDLLRLGGAAAVKLDALTRTVGLTTGSFYHHFSGMADYVEQLARYYGDDQVNTGLAALDDPDPLARLRNLSRAATEGAMRPLDAAMRDWAGSYPVADEAVRAADRALMAFVARAFADLGLPEDDARTRARVLISVGVARVHPPWPLAPDAADYVLALLTHTCSP